jgi:hypothetical protein
MPEPVRNNLPAADHVTAQLAACRRSVGLSLAWEPAVCERRGSRAELVAHLIDESFDLRRITVVGSIALALTRQ